MRTVSMLYAGGALLIFVMAGGSACAQHKTVVTMKNGATFAGLIVSETDRHLDLELGQGRIRLDKRRIMTRLDQKPPVVKKAPKPTIDPSTLKVPRFPDLPAVSKSAEIGSKAGNSAASLSDAPLPEGTPEHAVASFLRLIGSGQAQLAVDQWVNTERILIDFFPAHAKALTRYSLRKATESWGRILRMVFADPKLMAAVRQDGIEVRTVRETGGRSLVEIALPPDDESGEREIHLLSVENNQIVDFGYMLWSLKKVCAELSHQLEGAGSWVLVPLLDKTAERILAARSGEDGKPIKAVRIPTVSELTEIQPKRKKIPGNEMVREDARYSIIIPPTWKRVSAVELPKFADIMVQSRSKKAFAMVLVERSPMVLSALERAARANLSQVADEVKIHTRRLVSIPHGEAVRFSAEATIAKIPLSYQYHLVTTKTHTYQVITWCHTEEYERFETTLENIIKSFDIMPPPKEEGQEEGSPEGGASGDGHLTKRILTPGHEGERSPAHAPTPPTAKKRTGLKERLFKLLGRKKKPVSLPKETSNN